jgi:hypothetical protein
VSSISCRSLTRPGNISRRLNVAFRSFGRPGTAFSIIKSYTGSTELTRGCIIRLRPVEDSRFNAGKLLLSLEVHVP